MIEEGPRVVVVCEQNIVTWHEIVSLHVCILSLSTIHQKANLHAHHGKFHGKMPALFMLTTFMSAQLYCLCCK